MNGDGIHRRIRTHRDARATSAGVALRVEAWCKASGFSRIEFELRAVDRIAVSRVRYEIEDHILCIHRQDGEEGLDSDLVELLPQRVFRPSTRNFLGPITARVSRTPESRTTVAVPDLRGPASKTVSVPLIGMRTASNIGHKPATISQADRFCGPGFISLLEESLGRSKHFSKVLPYFT